MDLSGQFGGASNSGYSLHAAQYYAAMYAAAPFETTVANVIEKGLEAVPDASRTRTIIETAVAAYQADLLDGGVADKWEVSRNTVISAVAAISRLSAVLTTSRIKRTSRF